MRNEKKNTNTAEGGGNFLKMQYKIFNISIPGGDSETEEMNRFLRGNRIVAVEKQLVTAGNVNYWSFCVQYIYSAASQINATQGERKEKIDYKNVLDATTFEIFSKLRVYRKQLAENDAVPAYAVYTDAELAEIAKLESITPKTLLSINGIGEKRVEKYGKLLCEIALFLYRKTKTSSRVLPENRC